MLEEDGREPRSTGSREGEVCSWPRGWLAGSSCGNAADCVAYPEASMGAAVPGLRGGKCQDGKAAASVSLERP